MLRTIADQPTLSDSVLPEELLELPAELARVEALLDDPAFFEPFGPTSTPGGVVRRFRWRRTCG